MCVCVCVCVTYMLYKLVEVWELKTQMFDKNVITIFLRTKFDLQTFGDGKNSPNTVDTSCKTLLKRFTCS